MKNSIKLVAGSFLAAAAFVVSGSAALAGEGGAAGSVSAKLTSGDVTGISSSIAVGKNAAATTARTNASDTFTSAIGAAGQLNVTDANKAEAGYVAATDANLGNAQTNQLNGDGEINATTGVLSLP
jgi:hypothetical protein